MSYEYHVYIITNEKNGTLYIGVTSDISRRFFEHKNKLVKGFSNKYNLNRLVYCEVFGSIQNAIIREKQLKNWKRKWKIELIEKNNRRWLDISDTII